MVIRKFHDLNRDGLHDAIEPMLPDIPFSVAGGDWTVQHGTDSRGVIRMCFPDPLDVRIEELTRLTGGEWYTTTPLKPVWHIGCGENDIWIGNAQIGAPRTGNRGAHWGWRAAGGPQRYF
jgi:hypothetical protein